MPTPQDIWSNFYAGNYDEVIQCMKEDDTLVNTVDEKNCSFLFWALKGSRTGDERQKMLEYIVTHPKLKWEHRENEEAPTNVHALVNCARHDLIALVVNNPKFLTNEHQLTYELAKTSFEKYVKELPTVEKKAPKSARCLNLKEYINNFPAVMSLLRDATIMRALLTDDATLLTRLANAGGEPSREMSNGVCMNTLLAKSHENIRTWLKEKSESIGKNPNSFYSKAKRLQDLEAQSVQLEQGYVQKKLDLNIKQVDLIDKHAAETETIIRSIKK